MKAMKAISDADFALLAVALPVLVAAFPRSAPPRQANLARRAALLAKKLARQRKKPANS